MKDSTKKVAILNNFVSPYISEVIVIFKDHDLRLESKAIEDAEKIVADYIEKLNKNGQPKKPTVRKKSIFTKLAVSCGIIAIAAAAYFIFK